MRIGENDVVCLVCEWVHVAMEVEADAILGWLIGSWSNKLMRRGGTIENRWNAMKRW